MKKLLLIFTFIIISTYAIEAKTTTITDVPNTDPSYKYISEAISNGYMSLSKDDKFFPDNNISRKDMAMMLNKLVTDAPFQKADLSKADLDELLTLSKSFKKYIIDTDLLYSDIKQKNSKIENEQIVLNHEISRLSDELDKTRKDNDNQHLYMILGIVTAALMAIFIH